MIGWFSEKQAEQYGSVWYTTPEGKKVEVTTVGNTCEWPDAVCVGVVLHFCGEGRPAKSFRSIL